MSPKIFACIPYYKDAEKLDKAIKALRKSTIDIGEVVVRNDETGAGFTDSVNYLLREAVAEEADYAVVVNQDCYVTPDAVQNLVKFMENTPKCFLAGVKQLDPNEPDRIIHGGTKECYPAGVHEGGLVSKGECSETKQVLWVNGACFIVRLKDLLAVGLMDPNYKMFGSDSDWSYTARARGFECWYVAEAVVHHEQGASKEMKDEMKKVFFADMRYFRDKWMTDEVYRDLSMEVF